MAGIPALKLLVVLSVAGVVLLFLLPSSSLLTRSHDFLKSLQQSHHWHDNDTPAIVESTSSISSISASDVAVATPAQIQDDAVLATASETGKSAFDFGKWYFQTDIPYALPQFDVSRLGAIAPQHYQGPGHETFATYFASRNSSMEDPYFIAAQQIVYRLLWDPRSKTKKYPVTVFVAPFISEEQRSYFSAAGALVRELPLVPFNPDPQADKHIAGRLVDMFSKLEFWNQTEFSRIAYLDSDAFPLVNLDSMFDIAPERHCHQDRLSSAWPTISSTCEYVLAGHMENPQTVNAGVLVLKPDTGMYGLLLQEFHNTTDFDYGFVEQAFLSKFFRLDGPFPPSTFGEEYNSNPDRREKGLDIYILHTKIWAYFFGETHWAAHIFNDTWIDMLQFYEDDGFADLRLSSSTH
nr:galactinol synthase 7 [Quercus suber]